MNRRRFLLGMGTTLGAGGLLSACSTPVPFDEARIRAEYPPNGSFVNVYGLRIHYWEAGEGSPVVLIHGASGNLRDWTFDIAPMLADKHRVIVFDRPGFGYSDRPTVKGWDPEVQARVLKAAATKLGMKRPIVVGHSWGGAVAVGWALANPREVRGIVPVSAVTIPFGGFASLVNAVGLDGVIVRAYMDSLLSRAREGGIEQFIGRVFRPQRIPAGYIEHVGAPLALRERTLRANGEDLQNINIALNDMAPRYPSLAVPMEIVHGQEDFIDWEDQAAVLAETVPNGRLTLLPGVGHMAHHAAPKEIGYAIDRIEQSA